MTYTWSIPGVFKDIHVPDSNRILQTYFESGVLEYFKTLIFRYVILGVRRSVFGRIRFGFFRSVTGKQQEERLLSCFFFLTVFCTAPQLSDYLDKDIWGLQYIFSFDSRGPSAHLGGNLKLHL